MQLYFVYILYIFHKESFSQVMMEERDGLGMQVYR